MYRVIIVEDEIFVLNYMNRMLKMFEEIQVTALFSSPEEVIQSSALPDADVAFLDIEMPYMSGIELARVLTEKQPDLLIVFTTAYSKYAVDAFGVEAIDYLLKPVNPRDILRVIKRLNKVKPQSGYLSDKGPKDKETKHIKPYKVRCFGRFEVMKEVNEIIRWPTKKTEELFAYFLMHKDNYIDKWKLLDKFWPEMDEERGMHNLYNTVYRIKQTIKNLPESPNIEKAGDSYVLRAGPLFTDIDMLNLIDDKAFILQEDTVIDARTLFLSYVTPLFGTRDYIWSFSMQENVAKIYKRVCKKLIHYYRERDDLEQAEEMIFHYVKQHPENVDMMLWWFDILGDLKGGEEKTAGYKTWFNNILAQMDLPLL